MVKRIIIYWRDIPCAVLVQRRRERAKVQLGQRFQAAIDRAAMRAGKGSSDAYLSEWRRESASCESDLPLQQLAEREADQLESAFTDDQLQRLIRQHGVVTAERGVADE